MVYKIPRNSNVHMKLYSSSPRGDNWGSEEMKAVEVRDQLNE